MKDFPVRAWIYTLVVAAGTGGAVAVLLRDGPSPALGIAAGFGVLFLLAELAPIAFAHSTYSVSFVIAFAALASIGPVEAAIAASFGALDLSLRTRRDWLGRMFFNGAQLSFSTALAGAVYVATGGPIGSISAADFPEVFVPIAAASASYFVVNTSLVAGMVSLVRRVRFWEVWSADYHKVIGSTLALAVLGVLLAALYAELKLAAIAFVLVPLIVARRVLQATVKMDEAYEATLAALVSAIEAKDAYTSGHAGRVAEITGMIAREYGLHERQVRALRIAALMHDVGKLVVPTSILAKPGKLTADEYEHMKTHPIHGCEIVAEIDFLRDGEAVNAVRHHHERMDGRGYPDGLDGEEIPLTARIVMVADAFDSMTSTRSYRMAKDVEAGIAELRRCAGTQFDPDVIAALERAISRRGWEPHPETYEGERTPRPEVGVHAAFLAGAMLTGR